MKYHSSKTLKKNHKCSTKKHLSKVGAIHFRCTLPPFNTPLQHFSSFFYHPSTGLQIKIDTFCPTAITLHVAFVLCSPFISPLHHPPIPPTNSLWVCIKPSQKTFVVNKRKSSGELKNNLTEKEQCHEQLRVEGSRMDRWQTSHTWMKWRDGRKDCRELMVNKADGQGKKNKKKKTRGKLQKHTAVKHSSNTRIHK